MQIWEGEAKSTLVPTWAFPGGSEGKESSSNAGDLGLIPGLGGLLEEGMATHSSIWPGEFHGQRRLVA